MSNNTKEVTSYLRSTVAAQANKKIEFKEGNYCYFTFNELMNGKIDESIFENLTEKSKIKRKKDSINVIIIAKTIKNIFESEEKKNSNFEDLTGIYYVPAILNKDGTLQYCKRKLPWIPREFLEPMIEPILSMGKCKDYDNYISENIKKIHNIENWKDYIKFVEDIYENVTESKFLEEKLSDVELEKNVYIIMDNTINATKSILHLYDNIISEYNECRLYENFINLDFNKVIQLKTNGIDEMSKHCGQMGGEYPLSPSQRECINQFTNMKEGEILAVNGPPGTGKTTLLQSIVANMYVEKALKKQKPPLIVASSTNNQAVTNIIESFSEINMIGYKNLEKRWIEGVKSFAVYFPSSSSKKNAENKGYHYTDLRGNNFVSRVENQQNIVKSKEKLFSECNLYFGCNNLSIDVCENKIHDLLCRLDSIRINFLETVHELELCGIKNKTIEEYLESLSNKIDKLDERVNFNKLRSEKWRKHFEKIPLLYKLLKFLKRYRKKIETRNRMFIEVEETFLDEYMTLDEIERKYSSINKDLKNKCRKLQKTYNEVKCIKEKYYDNLRKLKDLNINIFKGVKKKVTVNLDEINEMMDENLRYIEFWLAVHYYECRWVKGEDVLMGNQKGKTFKNVLNKLYNRLSMITPCYVMTFYQLPKNFLAYGDNKNCYLYNYIDLLIVDEAGQVSPEIAACSFSLAKKAVVVGDIYQIQPVWSINRELDIALMIEKGVISSKEDYEKLSDVGINASSSSVMKVASKSCRYMKFDNRGLFLSEHRRCYDEIISYCNELLYKGNLEPMRGRSDVDNKYKFLNLPQMGYRQIDFKKSMKSGSSRYNKKEASEIANWVNKNFEIIREAYHNENEEKLLGIITPFKAQVKCILSEFNKTVAEDIKKMVSVGTIHTFQGAERKIIIMSTVYGENDGCYFIDANKSMLNVAVSRAKDSFLVFGNINSLKNDRNSASGLIKKYIINNPVDDNLKIIKVV